MYRSRITEIVVFCYRVWGLQEAKDSLPEAFTAVDNACGGVLAELAGADDFKAGAGESASVRIVGGKVHAASLLFCWWHRLCGYVLDCQ